MARMILDYYNKL